MRFGLIAGIALMVSVSSVTRAEDQKDSSNKFKQILALRPSAIWKTITPNIYSEYQDQSLHSRPLKGFRADSEIMPDGSESIFEDALRKNGWSQDHSNGADGSDGGLVGYEKGPDKIVIERKFDCPDEDAAPAK